MAVGGDVDAHSRWEVAVGGGVNAHSSLPRTWLSPGKPLLYFFILGRLIWSWPRRSSKGKGAFPFYGAWSLQGSGMAAVYLQNSWSRHKIVTTPRVLWGRRVHFKGTWKKLLPISKRKQASQFLGFSMREGEAEPVYTAADHWKQSWANWTVYRTGLAKSVPQSHREKQPTKQTCECTGSRA